MTNTIQNKKRFTLIPVLLFLLVFSGMIWYGYSHFYVKQQKPAPVNNGLNSKLPAVTETKDLNKLEIYLQAEKDSAVKKEQRSHDPYNKVVERLAVTESLFKKYQSPGGIHFKVTPKDTKAETAEKEADRKMEQIYISLRGGNGSAKPEKMIIPADTPKAKYIKNTSGDPELKQLEGMLDKLIDIQHPELVKQRYQKKDSSIGAAKLGIKNSVTAVVHNTQVVSNGSTIKLRLTEDMKVGDEIIPKGNFLFGICSVTNERLTVQLTNLTYLNEVIPVSLSVYDVDGIEGIYIPGNISRDVTKDGTEQAISSFNLNSYDPSLTGQIANAGLQATKALLSKKVKRVRVTVKAGHHIILQNAHGY